MLWANFVSVTDGPFDLMKRKLWKPINEYGLVLIQMDHERVTHQGWKIIKMNLKYIWKTYKSNILKKNINSIMWLLNIQYDDPQIFS
jgi:hypothetical protein